MTTNSPAGVPHVAFSGRRALLALSALALGLLGWTLVVVVQRTAFPYDFVSWADDAVLNQLLKRQLGAPLYGSYADASSFTEPPGGVLLHHALLAPFGLSVSLVANRVLAQLWLMLAAALGVRVVARLRSARVAGAQTPRLLVAGAAAALALAGYTNSLADTLHPCTLELLMLAIAAAYAAGWSDLSARARLLVALVLPACAVWVTNAGAAIGLALSVIAISDTHVVRRERWLCAALSLLSPALALTALVAITHGAFWNWGVVLPWRQPWMPHHARYLVMALGALTPALVLIARAAPAADRDAPAARAFRRVGLLAAAYFVVALPAFMRVGGGAHALAALAFLCGMLALARVGDALAADVHPLPPAVLAAVAALQLLVWSPQRNAPHELDRTYAAAACARIREALACGERVLVDLGGACALQSSLPRDVPRDRLVSTMDLTWAGLGTRTGTAGRLAREEYDLLAIHALVPWAWPWAPQAKGWAWARYTKVAELQLMTSPRNMAFGLNDRLHFDDRQVVDLGIVLFERAREAGRHRAAADGTWKCTPAVRR